MSNAKSQEASLNRLTLITSPPPHVHAAVTVDKMVYLTILSLMPAVIWLIYLFGWQGLRFFLVCSVAAAGTEAVIGKLRGKALTLKDGTAVLTGLILALLLPPTIPSWMAALGAVVSISLGKQAFGGLGFNPFNPALIGKVFLTAAFSSHLTAWTSPGNFGTPVSSPLEIWREGNTLPAYQELILGQAGGFLGEYALWALLLGGLFLTVRGYVDWKVPLAFLGFTGVLMLCFGQDPLWHMLAGGLVFGAFYLAGDPVTTPVTSSGRVVFALGAAFCLVVIRLWGGYPEGMAYALLLMNGLTPLLNRYLRPRKRRVSFHA